MGGRSSEKWCVQQLYNEHGFELFQKWKMNATFSHKEGFEVISHSDAALYDIFLFWFSSHLPTPRTFLPYRYQRRRGVEVGQSPHLQI